MVTLKMFPIGSMNQKYFGRSLLTRYNVRYFDTSRTSFSYYGILLLCILFVKTNLLNNNYYIFDHMLGESQQTFFTVKDISAREFIEAFAQYLKKNNLIERPAWADFVKTATRSELAPLDDDWIYYRVASLARKIYLRPRAGVRLLSHLYGGLKRGGCASEHHDHASTKIIRWGLQQLEKQKYIKKDKKGDGLKVNARIISDEGRRTLNRIATEHIKNRK